MGHAHNSTVRFTACFTVAWFVQLSGGSVVATVSLCRGVIATWLKPQAYVYISIIYTCDIAHACSVRGTRGGHARVC